MFHAVPSTPEAEYSDTLALDLATVEPSLAGPKRPQDRVRLRDAKTSLAAGAQGDARRQAQADGRKPVRPSAERRLESEGGGGTAVGAEDPPRDGRDPARISRRPSATARS